MFRNAVKNTFGHSIDRFVFLFSVTLFLSASLCFIVQPMIGKLLLPMIGGAPTGWLVTMVYFQLVLLAGYTIAHLLSRVSPIAHALTVCVLLVCGLISLPVHLDGSVLDNESLPETVRVFVLLAQNLTFPCVALFSLSPSLQRLFDSGSGKRDPYFLFAASNLGSLGGLLSYPFLVERVSGLQAQIHVWHIAYILLAVLCFTCVVFVKLSGKSKPVASAKNKTPCTWKQRITWITLAFVPSSLMLGLTAHVTADTGSVPLFWVLPLALYLLTFIMAFSEKKIFDPPWLPQMHLMSVVLLLTLNIVPGAIGGGMGEVIFGLFAFLFTALVFHYRLSAIRPSSQKLTEYYLCVAIGGALGGIFNTFLAPFIFVLPIEFTLVALLSCFLYRNQPKLKGDNIKYVIFAAAAFAIAATGLALFLSTKIPPIFACVLLLASLAIVSMRPVWFATLGIVLCLVTFGVQTQLAMKHVERDFFGVLKVVEQNEGGEKVRMFLHGTTLHGLEIISAPDSGVNGYYDRLGPLGDVMSVFQGKQVAVIGLGIGQISCYKAPGRHFVYYEISPAVERVARDWFSFLSRCTADEVIIGDGRKEIALAPAGKFDLIVVDAFTSDTIPVHLLTKEAFEIYFSKLAPHGIVAVHITNRFYDLRDTVQNMMSILDRHALFRHFKPLASNKTARETFWVAAAKDPAALAQLRSMGWSEMDGSSHRVWTDDYSDTLSALGNIRNAK